MHFEFVFLAIGILINVAYYLIRYRRLQSVKELSWKIMEQLDSKRTTAATYAQQLTYPTHSIKTVAALQPDFDVLYTLVDTTINSYYVVKGVYKVADNKYLVIADTLTYKPNRRRRNNTLEMLDSNMLYTSHIYITKVSPDTLACYSVKPKDNFQKAHNVDFSRYLLATIYHDEYTFSFEPINPFR